MFGVGVSLKKSSFKNVVLFPKPLIIGLFSQIVILPIIATIIVYFSNLPIPYKIGLIILASCPGGTTSGFITYFFKGNVALSIIFTSVNSLLTLFSIPFIINLSFLFFLGSSTEIHLSYLETIIQIFFVTILPVTLGLLTSTYFPNFSLKIQKPLKYILIVALGIVFLIKLFAGENNGGTGITMAEITQILPYALLLNFSCLMWGLLLGKITKMNAQNTYTISIESAVHNTTLAFLVAGTLLQNQDMVKPSLIYAMFSFWTAVLFSLIIKKITKF
jgi:BASS family bile acid:Na+ symporter